MSGVNKVILIGHLGTDPEVKFTPNGTAIATFNLATSEKRKDKDGNWTDHTEWHRIVAFGKVAQNCGQYLKKGKQVYIEGSISSRQYKDKEGQNRTIFEIKASQVLFLGKADSDRNNEEQLDEPEPSEKDDDIPF
jgi:single-strand DNA-binding protein